MWVPFWTLPVPGDVAGLIAAEVRAVQVGEVEVAGRGIHWVGGSGPGRKRIRLNRKKPCTPRGTICACSSTCVEEVALFLGTLVFQVLIAKGGDAISMIWRTVLFIPRTGVG